MQLIGVRTSSVGDVNERAEAFVAGCGYEQRSVAISKLITGPKQRVAMCFEEWPESLARRRNEEEFRSHGFSLATLAGNDSRGAQGISEESVRSAAGVCKAAAFDISSMTRAWHGGIVRQLRMMSLDGTFESFFVYAPAIYKAPPARIPPNEIIAPVDGFGSLVAPDLPIAAVIGMGYERERALGLQQFLDPQRTLLMIPKGNETDPYYAALVHNNRSLLDRTDSNCKFEYDLTDPSSAFSTLASVVGGLRESYRVVLTSLGPKIFGMLCFLVASQFPDVSVWRVSAGSHGRPRDAIADLDRIIVAAASWAPTSSSRSGLK